MNRVYVVDENLPYPKDFNVDGYPFIRFKKGTLDKDIIIFIKNIENPVILFTKNYRHFVKKLKPTDIVVNLGDKVVVDKILEEAINYGTFISTTSTKIQKYKKFTVALDESYRTSGTSRKLRIKN